MNRKGLASYIMASSIVTVAFVLYILPVNVVSAVTTTTTTTVFGWLAPDGTHWNNGIGALLFPLVGVGLFAGMGRVLDLEGDVGVTLILAGLTIGGLVSMLSLTSSSNSVIPFALIIVPGIDLVFWLWKGQG